jgi:hypothetical protein
LFEIKAEYIRKYIYYSPMHYYTILHYITVYFYLLLFTEVSSSVTSVNSNVIFELHVVQDLGNSAVTCT